MGGSLFPLHMVLTHATWCTDEKEDIVLYCYRRTVSFNGAFGAQIRIIQGRKQIKCLSYLNPIVTLINSFNRHGWILLCVI